MNKHELAGSSGALFLEQLGNAGGAALEAVRHAFASARESLRQAVRERRACAQLYEMNDRELSDIGLSRSDLPRIARGEGR
jgi:uncharacterized protein YjiS (DUF1127 family)